MQSTCRITGDGILAFRDLIATVDGLFSISRIEVNAELVLSQPQSLAEVILAGGSIRGAASSIHFLLDNNFIGFYFDSKKRHYHGGHDMAVWSSVDSICSVRYLVHHRKYLFNIFVG